MALRTVIPSPPLSLDRHLYTSTIITEGSGGDRAKSSISFGKWPISATKRSRQRFRSACSPPGRESTEAPWSHCSPIHASSPSSHFFAPPQEPTSPEDPCFLRPTRNRCSFELRYTRCLLRSFLSFLSFFLFLFPDGSNGEIIIYEISFGCVSDAFGGLSVYSFKINVIYIYREREMYNNFNQLDLRNETLLR